MALVIWMPVENNYNDSLNSFSMPSYGNFSMYDDGYPWKFGSFNDQEEEEEEGGGGGGGVDKGFHVNDAVHFPNKFANFSVYGFASGSYNICNFLVTLQGSKV